jgi:hypothetical protein
LPTTANLDPRDFIDLACWLIVQTGPISLNVTTPPKGQRGPGIEPDRAADEFWWETVALKRYRSHPIMLIADQPQSYPSYHDIAPAVHITSNQLT